MLFSILRWLLVTLTGRGYDRSPTVNTLHHKLAYRLHRLLPKFGIRGLRRVDVPRITGAHMYVRAEDGGVAHQLLMYRHYEPFETSIVGKYLKPGMTVYNIGANLGYYVLHASRIVGKSGKVYAFEPAKENLELLRRTVEENGCLNVTIVDRAVGAKVGEAALAISNSNSGDHQLRNVAGREHQTVSVTTVDALIAEGLEAPEAIILDVQGSELDVVQGMRGLLAKGFPKVLFTEFWPKGLNERTPGGAKLFLETLESNGFELRLIDERTKSLSRITSAELLASTTGHEERNLLCIRK